MVESFTDVGRAREPATAGGSASLLDNVGGVRTPAAAAAALEREWPYHDLVSPFVCLIDFVVASFRSSFYCRSSHCASRRNHWPVVWFGFGCCWYSLEEEERPYVDSDLGTRNAEKGLT